MSEFRNIRLTIRGNRADLLLCRPGKHNAINPEMTEELHEALSELEQRNDVLFVVLAGEGPSFCAGADLEWFAGSVNREQSLVRLEYERLALLLRRFFMLPQVTFAVAHQHVAGGGNGLLAVCDFTVADETTSFVFSEVRLGIIPAIIMPFVGKRMGMRHLRKLIFSGQRFGAAEAQLTGLIDFIAGGNGQMKLVDGLISELEAVSPAALRASKQLLLKVDAGEVGPDHGEYTASVLTELIYSEQGREGLRAFLEKRRPDWIRHH